MHTREFLTDWVSRRKPARVLDYGCGAGEIVGALRERNIDTWGCDVFYEGGDYSTHIPTALQPFIRRMQPAVPFESGSFDLVLSNQVFEHVPDMDFALREIARVLKPGGIAVNIFPDRSIWREGHCGIPFLHRFPKGNLRVYYAATLRSLGLGYWTEGKTALQWSRNFCQWLDNWTHYRPLHEIDRQFNALIGPTEHVEEDRFRGKFEGRFDTLPIWLQRLIVRKTGGLMLVSVKTHVG
jgi:SAM-dependent methyltransferase